MQQPYNKDSDAILYNRPAEFSTINFGAGTFCIFFPDDAHMPNVQAGGPSNVCKVIIKVKINA